MVCLLFLAETYDMDHLQVFHRFEWLPFDTNHGSLPDCRILATHEQMLNGQIYVGCTSPAKDDLQVVASSDPSHDVRQRRVVDG